MNVEKKGEETPDPILEFNAVEDEELRAGKLPEAELNKDAPEDKTAERNADGTFKGEKKEKEKAAADDKGKEKDKKEPEKKDDTVPLAKYLDDRNRYKAELEQRDLTIKQIQDRLEAFEKKHAPKEAEAPDYVEDPQGYVDHKVQRALSALEQASKKAEDQGKKAEETASKARETAELQGFMQQLSAHESRYVAANPDYHDALAHMRGIRAFQLKQFQPDITDEQISSVIAQEEINLAVQLARAGRDPVATAHELAKRYGFVPKKAPTEEQLKALKPDGKTLPPDQSLGGGHGAPDLSNEQEDRPDEVATALASLRKARA